MNDASNPAHDAAVLLMLLSDVEAASLIGELDASEIERLGAIMVGMNEVAEDDAAVALERFVGAASGDVSVSVDGRARTRSFLTTALGQHRGEAVLAKFQDDRAQRFPSLGELEDVAIADLVAPLHSQIAALIMTDVSPARAGKILSHLPAATQDDLVERIARMRESCPQAAKAVDQFIGLSDIKTKPAPATILNGVSSAAGVLNSVRKGFEQTILKSISRRDKGLAQSISDEMFVFADIERLPSRELGQLMRAIDAGQLVLALKGVSAASRDKMLSTLSARASEAISDEISEMGAVTALDVDAAQKHMVATARRMEREGVLNLSGSTDLV